MKEIKICTAYDYKGERVTVIPQEQGALGECTPVYESVPGWDEDITKATKWEDLPDNCQKYIERIEDLTGVRVSIISVGPERDQTIMR